jgi:hypothetical protein
LYRLGVRGRVVLALWLAAAAAAFDDERATLLILFYAIKSVLS